MTKRAAEASGPGAYRDPGVSAYELLGGVLVRCPRCDAPVRIVPIDPSGPGPAAGAARTTDVPGADDRGHRPRTRWSVDRRLACGGCGHVETWPDPRTGGRSAALHHDGRDPWFGHPLLLRTACAGHTLWAYDEERLDLLEAYVAAGVRVRPHLRPGRSMSVPEKLPRWLKAAKHRTPVLAACRRLRDRIPPGL